MMQAFGPYAGKEEIDFTQLGARTMFVISGKTGSGKTTIFDGISYAIYGKASGEDRSGADLRSQFAEDKLPTEVALTFRLRNKTYFIKRAPQQEKKKDRGEGYTTVGAKAELYMEDETGKKLLIAANVRDVDEKIKEIMLIDSNQFRQILMIPQGEFRKLLTSDSKEKELILQRLFHTEIYKRVEDKLKEEATELKSSVEWQRGERNSAISRIQAVFQEDLKNLLLEGNRDDLVIIPLLKEEVALLSSELDRLHKEVQEKEKDRDKLQQQLYEAEAIMKQLHAKEELKEKKEKLESNLALVEEQEKSIVLAQKAALLSNQEELCQRLRRELDESKTSEEEIKKKISILKEEHQQWETALQKEKDREPVRKEALEKINRLRNMEEEVRSLSQFRLTVEKLQFELEQKKIERIKIEERIKTIDSNSKVLTEEKNQIDAEQVVFFENERKLDKLKQESEQLEDYKQQQKQYRDACKDVASKKAFFLQLQNRFLDAKSLVQELEQNWLHGQAAILADKLQSGEGCPVCGSIDHPNPATKTAKNIPNEEDLKAAKQQYTELENEKSIAESALLKAETMEKSVSDRKTELLNKMTEVRPDFNEDELDIVYHTVLGEIQRLLLEQKTLLEKKNKLPKIITAIAKQGEERLLQVSQLEKITAEEQEATIQYTKNNTLLSQMMEKIPERLQSIEEFQKALQQALKEHEDLLKRLEQVQQKFQQTNEKLVTEKTRQEETEKQVKELERKLNVERDIFSIKMTEQGFIGYASYHSAKRTDQDINKLQQEVRSFREEFRSVKDRYEELSTILNDIKTPDITNLKLSFDTITLDIKALQDLYTNLIVRKKEDEDILSKIDRINSEIKVLEERYQLIGHLYEMTKGQNTYRITFERYVLAAFLDDILREANQRLAKMTSGRYELHRKTDRSKGNVQSGLELLVYDQYTGQERHVKTLSGGESFKAALSLALGLADIVQQYAGGVSLETMFIDEGFGTLDPESLDQSIETLIDIQSSGRLVGIISHVPELKERIDARLEVFATKSGSTTEFQFLNE